MKGFILTTFVLFLICSISCQRKQENHFLQIDLSTDIGQKQGKFFSLNPIVSEYQLCPLKTTDSTLLMNPNVILVTNTDVWLTENGAIYCFHRKTGKCLSKIDHRGNGPEEYSFMHAIAVDTVFNQVLVYDENKKKVLRYNCDNKFIDATHIEHISDMEFLNDSLLAVCYSPFSDSPHRIGVYNRQWQRVDSMMTRIKDPFMGKGPFLYYESIHPLDGKLTHHIPFNDTIYSILTDKVEPCLVVSKGRLTIPGEIANSLSKEKRNEYIVEGRNEYVFPYYFLTMFYQTQMYNDVWDVKRSTLIYRNIAQNADDKLGMAFIIEEKEVYLKPVYSSGTVVCCLAEVHDMMDIIPALKEDDNPVLVFLTLKKENS